MFIFLKCMIFLEKRVHIHFFIFANFTEFVLQIITQTKKSYFVLLAHMKGIWSILISYQYKILSIILTIGYYYKLIGSDIGIYHCNFCCIPKIIIYKELKYGKEKICWIGVIVYLFIYYRSNDCLLLG